LIRIPTEQRITRVGIDGPKHAVCGGCFDLMVERVASEGRVIGLNVELERFFEPVRAEECDAARDIEVVLMLRRLLRLSRRY
jgi:hypothetical protein